MPLKPCRECKKEVSTEADICPQCGVKKPTAARTDISARTGCGILLIVLVVLGIAISSSTPTSTPASSQSFVTSGGGGATSPTGRWIGQTTRSEMDGSVGYHTELEADLPIQTWLRRITPRLAVRCRENKTNVFIHTETAAQPELGLYDEARVRLRFNDGPPERQRWTESTDDEALFAPSPISLARRIAKAQSLRFEFTPFNAPPAVATFTLTGSSDAVERVATACKWTL